MGRRNGALLTVIGAGVLTGSLVVASVSFVGAAPGPSTSEIEVKNDTGAALPVADGGGALSVDDNGSSLTVNGTVDVTDGGGALSVDDNGSSLTVNGTVGLDPNANAVRDATKTALAHHDSLTAKWSCAPIVGCSSGVDFADIDVADYREVRVTLRRLTAASACSGATSSIEAGSYDADFVEIVDPPSYPSGDAHWTGVLDLPATTLRVALVNPGTDDCTIDVAVYGRAN